VSIQGVANTGNTQNAIGVSDGTGFFDDDDFFDGDNDEFFEDCFFVDGFLFCEDDEDFGGLFDDDNYDGFIDAGDGNDNFEFDEVGSSITVSPTNITTSDQQVNQAATASG